MNILVTGANGYLGQGVVSHILDTNNNVIACDFSTDHVDNRAKTGCSFTSCMARWVYPLF